ncbi:fumarylacetoacetate hydrolase family protein [Bradyrhizobium sp. U87765 SZCCT0131]|uniref:fumarylacetoacetate hydrolase family protein n=1 Tax=unclassified Bradyrhizobium TaxID=2631580 RepID=UPI001BAAC604|nr:MULTISPECIES: fumarylacetoacetate hydrolase family protein [unclassified Bradyrhizobium]MBR1218966.1 fumarylacetoacetate hydrolase family protein [Bradyrhizobium sp. U87765 SZCCT0131]MBR1261617.1 fumarylacetoacetate hydrolase family protein [Bradyrhizobium sp. U87765 SZCCT0134]MBR1306530.1 fumarylacetoacetate hydrolase family protein [Bradyrhizobium sp. U87765 SZCCT0110]MBR1317399.1 fumarylacetoacetate hydrolase family protein [Bradyrhizobium sp. U87765 SZCCT0109]MBR1351101.1 fumarylacetoac
MLASRITHEISTIALPIAGTDTFFGVRRVYCVGRNYVDHIREMKEGDERDPPFFFQKPADSIMQDGATLPYPPLTEDYQHEIELVVAIGRGGARIPLAQALDHVAGYAVGLDMTRRDRQRDARASGQPWEIGKSFDHSAPCGPIYPASAVGHITAGAITLAVNGTVRQRGDIGHMIWNVAEIVANLSQHYTLGSGDLIFTGTPAGVGPLVPGDRMVGAIDGLGEINFTVGEKEA